MFRNIYTVLNRNFLIFKKAPIGNLVQLTMEPLIYLLAFGGGFAHLIKTINGVSVVEHYYPGRLCNTAMMVAFFEGTYPTLSKFTYQNTYLSMSLGSIRNKEIVFGELLWCAIKGFIAALITVFFSSVLGIGSYRIIYVLPVIFALSFIFSAMAMTITSHIEKSSVFSYISSFLILPISLFSGSFIPLDGFPKYVQFFSNLLPSTHAITLSRSILAGTFAAKDYIHISVVLGYLIVLTMCCYYFFKKRLDEF